MSRNKQGRHYNRPSYNKPTRRRRQNRRLQFTLLIIALVTAACLFATNAIGQCRSNHSVAYSGPLDPRALTTVTTPDSIPSQIIEYKAMTVSFNPMTHIPNWVAWELTADHATGSEPRTNQFFQDYDVDGCGSPDDYRNSGYDRGHLAPAGDMKWDSEAMRQSFLLTNIAPQYPDLNRGTWRRVEEKTRNKAVIDSIVYVVAGPIVNQPVEMTIGRTGIAVPDYFFKVIINPYANPPKGIGFIFPNGPTQGGMQPYAVSIDSIEALTGYDFFPTLPADLQHIEANTNFNRWSRNH
ncbi:MAG: DNA/RNA non-specific endonuclease [Muribaculaceae bacterium]|nr:DNA/RNA non-specific endonuclease [Muribaculaceae bacterium]